MELKKKKTYRVKEGVTLFDKPLLGFAITRKCKPRKGDNDTFYMGYCLREGSDRWIAVTRMAKTWLESIVEE